MREIQVFKEKRLRQVIGIAERNYVVGRSMSADIVIPDQRISRKHCAIYYDPDTERFQVADLNSKLGTMVNGEKIERHRALSEGDTISFGPRSAFSLAFERSSSDTAPEDAPRPRERLTKTIDTREMVKQSDARLRDRPPEKRGDAKEFLEIEQIASSFYDLSCRLALASHNQQIYEILVDHIFGATPAERAIVVRNLRPQPPASEEPVSEEEALARKKARKNAPPFEPGDLAMLFCEFAASAPVAARRPGAAYSRSMIGQAMNEQKAMLFHMEDEGDASASQLHINATSSICAPIVASGGAIGCVCLDSFDPNPGGGFNESHLELVGMCAYIFGLYLERQRALEEKRESERLASAGLAVFGAAHYLKNVLTGLQGSRQVIEMLLKSKDYQQLEATWGVLTRSVDAVGATVQKMLEFARSGRLELTDANPIQLMREACEPYLHLFQKRAILFEMEQGGDPFPIRCDASAIDDILQNLLSNAIDAFKFDRREDKPPAAVTMRVLFHEGVGPDRGVAFEVQDNGPGIPEQAREKLFDLFFSTKGAGGSGLGLALCRKHANAHGGKLTFKTSGEGTTFRLWLPQGDPSAPVSGEFAAPRLPSEPPDPYDSLG